MRSLSGRLSIAVHKSAARSRAISSVRRVRRGRFLRGRLPRQAPAIASLAVERQTPRHPHQPGPEPLAVAELVEAAVRLDERFLRDILGVLPMAQHAVGHAKRQRRGFDQPRLELAFQRRVVHRDGPAGQSICEAMHPFIGQDAATSRLVQCTDGQPYYG